MLVNLFEKSGLMSSIILGVIFCFLCVVSFIFNKDTIFDTVSILDGFVFFLLNFLFLLFSAFVFFKNDITKDNLYAPFIMVLLYGMFPVSIKVDKTLLILFLLIFLYLKISELLTNNKKIMSRLFDRGLYIGVSSLIFDVTILFLVLIYLSLFLSKRNCFRNIIIPLVGFLVPIILYYTYCLITGTISVFYEKFQFKMSFNYESYRIIAFQIPIFMVSIFTTISVLSMFKRITLVKDVYSYQYILVLGMLFIGILLLITSPVKDGGEFLYIFIPVSVIITQFIKKIPKRGIKNFVLMMLFLFSTVMAIFQ